MKRNKFAWAASVLLGITGIFFLLPKTNCCDERDWILEEMTSRASAGDLPSIRYLYARARTEKVPPQEEYWALEGALQGDRSLRLAYSGIFNTIYTDERKQWMINHIRQNRSNLPGSHCLVVLLESGAEDRQCK